MSTATVTRRRLSVGVPSFAPAPAASRAPCSPITNEHPHPHTATKPPTARDRVPVLKKIRSFTSMLSRSPSPAPAPGPTKKELKDQRRAEKKKQQEDFASAYGSVFASEVALLQLLDGGSTTRNIERVHKAHAKSASRHGQHHGGVAAGAVRGPHGELFASAQDESERRGLVRGGYERSRSKRVHHADEDEAFYSAEEDAPAWAAFQPRQRSNTARAPANARDAFFAESFAPPMPARRA